MSSNTLDAANKLGEKKSTNAIPQEVCLPSPPFLLSYPLLPSTLSHHHQTNNPQNPSLISSAGAIGKQFNPDGAIGQIGEKVGGPFSKEGAIGGQFDASKNGIAGHVERAVDGPRNPSGSGTQ
jgi:hypothetical protein